MALRQRLQPQQVVKPLLETLSKAIKPANPDKHNPSGMRLQKGQTPCQQAYCEMAPKMDLTQKWHIREDIHCANMAAGLVFMW